MTKPTFDMDAALKALREHCIIHQIRNTMKYVASKNQKAFMADLKAGYICANLLRQSKIDLAIKGWTIHFFASPR